MSWKDVVCLCVAIAGLILFLYGANYFNGLIGWAGIYLLVGSFFAEIVLKVYENLMKREVG